MTGWLCKSVWREESQARFSHLQSFCTSSQKRPACLGLVMTHSSSIFCNHPSIASSTKTSEIRWHASQTPLCRYGLSFFAWVVWFPLRSSSRALLFIVRSFLLLQKGNFQIYGLLDQREVFWDLKRCRQKGNCVYESIRLLDHLSGRFWGHLI